MVFRCFLQMRNVFTCDFFFSFFLNYVGNERLPEASEMIVVRLENL